MKTSTNLSSNINGNLFVPQLSIDDVIKSIKTVNNKEIKVVYSPVQKTTTAYLVEEGRAQLIKPEDLPKELREVKDPASLQLLLENSYARASYLSNGDVKLYMEQRGLGGGKEDRTSSYWKKLLSNVKELVEERSGGELGLKAFISYAWEDTSTDAGKANSKLQRWLEGLRDDLQGVGVSVFLDIGDMHGDMGKRMRDNLAESDIILTINTPRYAQRATQVPQTNLGFEYELTLKKAEVNPKAVVTLHYDGELDKAYPETLKHFPRYDCRKLEDYSENLVGGKGLPGIIPTILGINAKEDTGYQNLVEQWREEKLNYLPEENKEFIGRSEQLEKLEKALEAKPVQTISGKEGIGKSELALKYANDHAEQYKIVRWINAEPGNLKKEFKQIAQELAINSKGLNLNKIIATINNHLESIPNWLLIFDNATDRSTIESYLPKPTEKGQHVIITSRSNEKWKGQVEVKAFSKAEAWEYIHKKLPSVSQSQAMELAHKVQYSPAKLTQATDYINAAGISLPYYIKTHLSFKNTKAQGEGATQKIINEDDIEEIGITKRDGLTNSKTGNTQQKDNSSKTPSLLKKKNSADFPTLLEKIKDEVLSQIKKDQVKAYISYATEDANTALGEENNEKLQNWIEKLQGSLEQTGMVVTTSSRDIHGNIEPMAEAELKGSDAILLINTPAYKQQVLASSETGLGYEYKLILEKAKEIPYGILPLLYSGGFSQSVPKELWGFLVRDCTNDSAYEENLVAPQNPKGIIPGIYNIDCDDTPQYKSIVQEWRWHKATIVPATNPNFLGREKVLAELEQKFSDSKDAISQRQVISATGGMGKSELAIAYANRHAGEYDMVRWLSSEGDKLSLEFNTLAIELGIDTKGMGLKDLIKGVHRALNEIPKYLLIFDNADNADLIKEYLPPQNKVGQHLIITSRNQQWSNCTVLDTFSEEECLQYIGNKIKDTDTHYAKELAKSVGYLPLALSQAVAYIQQEGTSIVSYLENYKSKGVESLAGEVGSNNILATWTISMEKVKQKSPEAAFMLEACSYLNPDNIPLSLFEHGGLLGDPSKVQEALRVLREYSLVQSSKVDDQIRVHRLVQAVTRHKDTSAESREQIVKKIEKLKSAIVASYPKYKIKANDYETVRELLPHIESLADNLKPYANLVQGRSGMKEVLQAYFKKTGVIVEKEAAEEYFAARLSDKLNAGVILQAELLSILSDGLYTLGDYSRSKEVLEKVIDIKERYYGQNTPEVSVTMTSLGITLRELGDSTSAQKILEKALSIQERVHSSGHPELADVLVALGTTLCSTGKYEESRKVLERALKIKESYNGLEHPEVASVLTGLANSMYYLKEYTKSKELLERALKIQEGYLGMDHPEVSITLASLGKTLSLLGEYEAGKEALEKALRIQEVHYGKEHLKVAAILTELHDVLQNLGDKEGSKNSLEKAILIKENSYGLSHPEVMSDILKLASAVGSSRDIDNTNADVRSKLEEAVKILEQHYGVNNLIVAVALGALSYQIKDIKDYAIRQSLLERVIQIKEYNYGSDHPKIISNLDALAYVFAQLGSINDQKSILEKLLKIKGYHYGLDHVEVANTLDGLAAVLNKEGDIETARSLIEKSLKIKEGYYGKDHPQLISSLEDLEKIISSKDNVLAQKEILTRIVKIKDNHYKLGNEEILNTAKKLQIALRKLDNIEEQSENAGRLLENLSKQSSTSYLEVIFKAGNGINTKDPYGNTPLIWAASKGLGEVALALIEKGANVHDKVSDGNTPLILAAKEGHAEVLLSLIEKGADINVKGYKGGTPLIRATTNGHTDTVLALLNKKADINAKNDEGKTALDIAKKEGKEDLIKLLKEKIAEAQNKEVVTVNAVTDILYDNELLNHPDLLKESLKAFNINQILDMSLNLDQGLVNEAVNSNDSSLVLAGLVSLTEENNYE